MEQKTDNGKHTLTLEKRNKLVLTGVLEVIGFDEELVTADTDCGVVIVRGAGLHIDGLNLEKGDMSLTGEVDSVAYEESYGAKGSFLGRLFK